jgi:hypothetical protein
MPDTFLLDLDGMEGVTGAEYGGVLIWAGLVGFYPPTVISTVLLHTPTCASPTR